MDNSATARRYRVLIGEALDCLAHGLRDVIEPRMERDLGPDWTRKLTSTKEGFPFARLDFASYARVLERGPHSAEMRRCFRVDYGTWSPLIRRVRDHRNHLHGHPDADATAEEALDAITACLSLAERLTLGYQSEIRDLVDRVQRMSRGVTFSEVDSAELARFQTDADRYAAEAERARGLEAEGQAAQAAAEDAQALAMQVKAEAQLAVEAREVELRDLQSQIAKVTAGTQDEADLRAELGEAHEERDQALSKADQAKRELRQARQQRRDAEKAAEQAARDMAEALERSAKLESELVAARVSVQRQAEVPRAQSSAASRRRARLDAREVDDRLERIAELIERLTGGGALSSDARVAALPKPGEAWAYPRGNDVWTLSKVHRSMTRIEDGASVAVLVGNAGVREVIDQFLVVRPQGGRVWVDDDGDACTFLDRRLVYLGRLEPASAVSQAPGGPQPGEPIEAPRGHRYTLARGSIVCRATGQELSEVVGKQTATAVANRLLAVKPKGGTLRVDRAGAAALYVGSDWVFAGRVTASEWFPGHVTSLGFEVA